MTRGRKPDAPGVQAAKGNPGKRKRKTPEARAAELASAPAAGEHHLSVPSFLGRSVKLAPALKIWRELEPELRRYNLLEQLDRYTFAMYCVHMADWIWATRQIASKGHSYTAKNVNGDKLMRLNPAVKVREIAEKHILEIGARFGLDPSNRYKLLRDQAAAPLGGLFEKAPDDGEAASEPQSTGPGEIDPVGLIAALASPPPGSRPN